MAHGALTIIVNCYFDNLQTQTEAADQSYNHNIRVGFTVNSMIRDDADYDPRQNVRKAASMGDITCLMLARLLPHQSSRGGA